MSLLSVAVALALFVAGALLLVSEAIMPGTHFFVLGVALLTAGLVGLFIPETLGIAGPILLAAIVLVVTGLTLWAYRRLDIYGGEGAAETTHSGSLRGQTGYVTERVTRHGGEVKLGDGGFNPYFQARSEGDPIEAGKRVRVTDPGGGNVVTVVPAPEGEAGESPATEAGGGSRTPADEEPGPTSTS